MDQSTVCHYCSMIFFFCCCSTCESEKWLNHCQFVNGCLAMTLYFYFIEIFFLLNFTRSSEGEKTESKRNRKKRKNNCSKIIDSQGKKAVQQMAQRQHRKNEKLVKLLGKHKCAALHIGFSCRKLKNPQTKRNDFAIKKIKKKVKTKGICLIHFSVSFLCLPEYKSKFIY